LGGYIKKLEIKSKLGNIEVEYDETKAVVSSVTRNQKFLRYHTSSRTLEFHLDEGGDEDSKRMLQGKSKVISNITYVIELILTDSFD
jgi:hypothetical protein